jgi:hypothetical protein
MERMALSSWGEHEGEIHPARNCAIAKDDNYLLEGK